MNLRCHVVWCPDCTIRQLPIPPIVFFQACCCFWSFLYEFVFLLGYFIKFLRSDLCMFAQSKIRQFDMSLRIYQYVVRFQVTMNIVQLMHTIQCQQYLSNVKPRLFLRKDVFFHE